MVTTSGESPATTGLSHSDYERIEHDAGFRELVSAKVRFILPATVFFLIYYFALPVLVGYFPGVMETKVIGDINLAYLFALSQFVMAWVVMYLYVRRAKVFDTMTAAIIAKLKGGPPS